MTDRSKEFDGLEAFFDAARAEAPQPSEDLMARILADAEAETARRAAPVPEAPSAIRPAAKVLGFWDALVLALGGRGALAGLAGAMVAGLWLGVSQPAPIASLAQQVAGDGTTLEQVDVIPTFDSYMQQADAGE
ncbi:hypothetical protein [Acidimangrovimonas pyrenivorans]|uniref:Dihydroorotate dehydrogenase n=1 Tax=Acidimangrovimonas pyrenivorans TaxID=2030798 RepID=A0ABV7ALG2_9RHOB